MDRQLIHDEAIKDQGALGSHPSYTDKDFEGHRAHTVYVGVHVPSVAHRRHPRHRRHHRHHRHHAKGDDAAGDDCRPLTPPALRVQFILGEYDEDELHESHPLFSEMEELFVDNEGEVEWREVARWVKFEEDVEEGGNRWSKPHVATLSLHSLFELRSYITNGSVMLDLEATTLDQIADLMIENMVTTKQLPEESRDRLKEVLLKRHRHQHERRHDNNKSRIPLIRSLADIGRVHSASKSSQAEGMEPSSSGSSLHRNMSGTHLTQNATSEGIAANPSSGDIQQKGNQHFMKKIPPGSEASNILVGELDILESTIVAFVRLSQAVMLGDLTEVPVPTKFVFVLMGPTGNIGRYHEIGRAIATLMSDEVFHDVAYKGKNRQDLLAGVDEFLDAVTVLPPGEWDPSIRIEPPNKIPSQDHRKTPGEQGKDEEMEALEKEKLLENSGLKRSGRFFGGMINDIKRKVPFYFSDFKDVLAIQCLASFIFLYFACLTPIITFGGLLGDATDNWMAAMESLVAGFICGVLYSLFSGQPLTLLSSTGPVLVFETIAFTYCNDHELDYLSVRVWIGVWTGFILIIIVAFDMSSFVCYITRFTEENFACLISLIFIWNAVEKVLDIGKKNPINNHDPILNNFDCHCIPPNASISSYFNKTSNSSFFNNIEDFENSMTTNYSLLTKLECESDAYNGTLVGIGCKYNGDIFLMSAILCIFTFMIAYGLKEFKTTSFFPTKVRMIVNDFAVVIAILSMTLLDYLTGLSTPKLDVPDKFEPTRKDRGWIIDPFHGLDWLICVGSVLPAILATILIFMDQQITAVIVNRSENKLKKGGGYHLDLFVLAILIILCSIMGLPWFVAGTVLSVSHVNSLKVESECAAPGEKPQFLGVREQRATHLLIFVMIGSSVALTPVLRFIPMPVLYGVFLYMGISSLKGLQFFDRMLILLMPAKYQPDYTYLRQVPLKRVHLFTAIQCICLIILWVLKANKSTSIAFPVMLVVMCAVRKLLDKVFTQPELKILDDVMPESTRRKQEEEKEKKDEEAAIWAHAEAQGIQFADSDNLQIPLVNGNIMKIPMDKIYERDINITEEVNKTGIWKQVNSGKMGNGISVNHTTGGDDGLNKEADPSSGNKKKRGTKKDAMTEEECKRLSTMAEEDDEEDTAIMIKIDSPTPVIIMPSKATGNDIRRNSTGSHETSV